jgi:hypothetical protein
MRRPRRCGGGKYGAKAHGHREWNRKRMEDVRCHDARGVPVLQVAATVLLFGSRNRRYTRSLEGGFFMVVRPHDERGPARAGPIIILGELRSWVGHEHRSAFFKHATQLLTHADRRGHFIILHFLHSFCSFLLYKKHPGVPV